MSLGRAIPQRTLEVLDLLHARCPGWEFHSGRVALLLSDFPHADPLVAASAAADFLMHGQDGRVRDPHGVLRRELERQHRQLQLEGRPTSSSSSRPDLSTYDRFLT